MPAPIHPRAQELIDMFLASGTPPLAEGTVQEGRERAETIPELLGPGPEVGGVTDVRIPSRQGEIPARIYRPAGPPTATLVYLHGGGWVVGSLDAFDPFTRVLVKETGWKVISVDYRLAPEHLFPCAVDDSFAALEWAAANQAEGPLLIGGDSAGGNLAAVCATRARDTGRPQLAMQILLYPVTDHDFDTGSYREQADNPLLSRADMIWFWDHYAPSAEDRDRADASPLRARISRVCPRPTSSPPSTIHCATRSSRTPGALRPQRAGDAEQVRRPGAQFHDDGQLHPHCARVDQGPCADRRRPAGHGRDLRQLSARFCRGGGATGIAGGSSAAYKADAGLLATAFRWGWTAASASRR